MHYNFFTVIGISLLGTVISSFLAIIPALHVYNVIAIILFTFGGLSTLIPQDLLPYLFLGMISGYVVLNTITSIFLSAPDESMIFVVLPGQKMLLAGRGYEAAIITGFGSIVAGVFLFFITPLVVKFLPVIRKLLMPHLFWILGAVSVYMLQSEWPKGLERGKTGWARFFEAWRHLSVGLLTFFASGLLGFIVMTKNPLPPTHAFQGMLPMFVGLFAIPWVLTNIVSQKSIPPQYNPRSVDLGFSSVVTAMIAGGLGGLLAATFPILTAGLGGLLAGQAVASKDERVFVISQGVSKTVYYVGSFLFFFIPGAHLGKGGLVAMMRPFYISVSPRGFYFALGALLVCLCVAFFLLLFYTRIVIKLLARISYRTISAFTLVLLLAIVYLMTGVYGLFIAAVATAIGLLPVMYGSRRVNCMGALLFPVTLNMAGYGGAFARLIGLG